MSDEGSENGGCSCKVGEVVDQYDLEYLDDELRERRRTGESLRALADYVNRRALEVTLERADAEAELFGALDRTDVVDAVHEALASPETSRDQTARVSTRLEQSGIDVDDLTGDWVTHPTVRAHLRTCLGIDTSREATLDRDDTVDTIEWSRTRCRRIVDRTLERAGAAGLVDVGDLEVSVSVTATCTDCGARFLPAELVDAGSCDCAREG